MTHQNSEKGYQKFAANPSFLDNMPQNTIGGLKMELALLNFSSKAAARLSNAINKTIEKRNELYKKMYTTHNKCQASAATQVQDFPDKDQHLKNL